jgi:hypothetical protein
LIEPWRMNCALGTLLHSYCDGFCKKFENVQRLETGKSYLLA